MPRSCSPWGCNSAAAGPPAPSPGGTRSSGFLRNPLEIALLLAIVQHWRTGAGRWLVSAALLAVASLWWVTDTGLANTLVLVAYVAGRVVLLTLSSFRRTPESRRLAPPPRPWHARSAPRPSAASR